MNLKTLRKSVSKTKVPLKVNRHRVLLVCFFAGMLAISLMSFGSVLGVWLEEELVIQNTNGDARRALRALHPSNNTYTSSYGEAFKTPNATYKLTKATFNVSQHGSPTGIGSVNLYATTGTYGVDAFPIGNPLASVSVNVSTLPANDASTWVNFSFPEAQQYIMEPNTVYFIAFQNPSSGNIDISNWVWVSDSFSDLWEGNHGYFSNGTWQTIDEDVRFKIYGLRENSTLEITSSPSNVTFTVDGTNKITPYSEPLENGSYVVVFPQEFWEGETTQWFFMYWDDNVSNNDPNRTINLQSNSSYSVTYHASEITPIDEPPVIPHGEGVNPFLQFFWEGDFLGFVQALYVAAFGSGELFWGLIVLLFTVPLYIRTKSLLFMCILHILIAGLILVAFPIISGTAMLLLIFGLAGMLYKIYMRIRGGG